MNPPVRPLMLVFLAVACAGTGEGLDRFGRPIDPNADTDVSPYERVRQNVFEPRCIRCHAGGEAPQGLDLEAVDSWRRLVDVPSKEVPSQKLVHPGDPDDSYLIIKLRESPEGRQGLRMPRDGPPYLDRFELGLVRDWIEDGALTGEEDTDDLLPRGGG